MTRLPRITPDEFLRALLRDGWYIDRQRGTSHAQLRHADKPGQVTVALHKRQIIAPKTLGSALKQAGLTADDLRRLL